MESVGALDCLEVEAVVVIGPAMLAKRLEPWMWVPVPMLVVFVGPRSWPGKAMGVFDILVDVIWLSSLMLFAKESNQSWGE